MAIRKIGVISRTYRHISRYREIIAILVKYGFGEILAKLELQKHFQGLYRFPHCRCLYCTGA